MQDLPVQGNPVQVNAVVVKQKSPESGDFGAVFGWTGTVPMRCERAQTGAFLAVTGAVCGAAAAWYLRTTSCRRVKLIYWLVGLFLRGNSVILVSAFLNEIKAAHLFERY